MLSALQKKNISIAFIAAGLFAVTALPILRWLLPVRPSYVQRMVPGMDGRPKATELISYDDKIYPEHQNFKSAFMGKQRAPWSQFRGPGRSGFIIESPELLSGAGSEPEFLWETSLGEGHAAPAIYGGRVFVLDYDEELAGDSLRCFSLLTGEELWRLSYDNPIKRNHGRSRSIPAVFGSVVVSVGPSGDVLAADIETGEFLWGFSIPRRYGGEIPLWYAAQCPLIIDGILYLAPGGQVQLAAYDLFTGDLLWELPNEHGWKMSHASLMLGELYGEPQILLTMLGGLSSISLDGIECWSFEWPPAVIAPSPLVIGDNRIFQSAGYGVGGLIIEIDNGGEDWSARLVREYSPGEGISTEQQTALYYEDRLWAVLPKDAGALREQFVCADVDGQILWSSGKDYRFGLGPWIAADGKFFILGDNGLLTAAIADIAGWSPLWSYQVLDGVDAWGPPALSDGLLLVRDSRTMRCFDIREKEGGE